MPNWLRKLTSAFTGRRKPLDKEIELVRAMLPRGDERTHALVQQLMSADYVELKRPSRDVLEISVPFVRGKSDLIDIYEDVRSPAVQLKDRTDGTELEFKVSVLRGGFLGPLECRRLDGERWSDGWEVDLDEVDVQIAAPWLPAALEPRRRQQLLAAFQNWLAHDEPQAVPDQAEVVVREPVSGEAVDEWEATHGARLPTDLAEFYGISDGLCWGEFEIPRLEDLYLVCDDQPEDCASVLIGHATDGTAIGIPLKQPGTGVFHLRTCSMGEADKIADSIRDYVRDCAVL